MKKLFLFIAAISLFYFGCTDVATNSVNQPVNSSKQMIQLPAKSVSSVKSGLSIESASGLSVSVNINGVIGDILFLDGNYTDVNGNKIFALATLIIPGGAFSGKQTLTMACDNTYAGLDFSPSITFNKSLYLTLSFSGLDLKSMGITNSNIDFYYVDGSGNYTAIPNSGVIVDRKTGTLTVIGAEINHFSRYAFAH
ncbi:MAG: hypothetical protein ABR980_04025 [Ignavibacteriaceae bacterium]|jgi:hypothetical protein